MLKLLILLFSLSGCAAVSYQAPTGEKFTLNKFFWMDSFDSIDATIGDKHIHIEGAYSSVDAQAVKATASGVAEGIVKGMK